MIEQRKHHLKTNDLATQTPLKNYWLSITNTTSKLMIEQHKHYLQTNDSATQTPLKN